MQKTPAVAYVSRKIKISGKKELYELLDDSPLKIKDYAFMSDIIEGLDNKALARKYRKSPSRISQWKRSVFEQVHEYEIHRKEWQKRQV